MSLRPTEDVLYYDKNRFTVSDDTWVADASDLELPPGSYPRVIGVWNGSKLWMYSLVRLDEAHNGCYLALEDAPYLRLTVFND